MSASALPAATATPGPVKPDSASAVATAAVATNLRFPLGSKTDAPAVATVTVERIAKDTQRKSLSELIRFDWFPGFIAEGVSVRFERLDLQPLPGLLEKLRTLAKVKRLEIRHLSLYAPGDSVPRLIAGEVETRPDGGWTLKRVLLAGHPSMNNCVLSVGTEGELRIAAGLRKPVALRSLLSEADTPAFVHAPPDFSPLPSSTGAVLAAKSPLSPDPPTRTKR